jgi:catechol 2,3-dioxygenase-like lactoylglutathione lyase family enzyme
MRPARGWTSLPGCPAPISPDCTCGCGHGHRSPTLEIFSYKRTVAGACPVVNEPGSGHLAVQVGDVAAGLEAVLAAGGSTGCEISSTDVPGVGRLCGVYARDPDGNLELQSWS